MKKQIYIIDDNPDYHFLMYTLLRKRVPAHSLSMFENGQSAYRHLNSLLIRKDYDQFPEMMIIDLKMEGMAGQQLLRLLKHPESEFYPFFAERPIIIMSAETSEAKIRKCYQEGADAYVIKPFTLQETQDVLDRICRFWLDKDNVQTY
ncbi:response regulator [Dyadobacter sandarakinus]|uniref:Response regulator n=1 Tax=Dyadobacter sandarakinus TaxID=2747268 RepID=A0ABX7I581_9BACT|nr:response regulator [Dyadobacter sandarakinus]QRR00697.1 response regulator [Dyadobacter sandarakinus]